MVYTDFRRLSSGTSVMTGHIHLMYQPFPFVFEDLHIRKNTALLDLGLSAPTSLYCRIAFKIGGFNANRITPNPWYLRGH